MLSFLWKSPAFLGRMWTCTCWRYKRKKKMCLIHLLSFDLTVMLSGRPITLHRFSLDYFSGEADDHFQKLHLKSAASGETQNKRDTSWWPARLWGKCQYASQNLWNHASLSVWAVVSQGFEMTACLQRRLLWLWLWSWQERRIGQEKTE